MVNSTASLTIDSCWHASLTTGEAWLTFSTPQEALRSVRDLNRHYLANRYLELSIC